MRRVIALVFLVVIVLGILALAAPAPVSARPPGCVDCPGGRPARGECEVLVKQTCDHCAFCKAIDGCIPR